jgi:tryptophan-rich sensory protein
MSPLQRAQRALSRTGQGIRDAVRGAAPLLLSTERYRWWHGAGLVVAANLVSLPGTLQSRNIYGQFQQAPFAPPAWAFGPAWSINNIATVWGNLRLLNLPADTPQRTTLLWLQGAGWVVFSTFSYAYFVLQSPILACAWTASYAALTLASMLVSSRIDLGITLSLVPLMLWLALASAVAAYQMLYNADPLFGTPPLLLAS